MSDIQIGEVKGRKGGQALFALGLVAVAALLLSLIGQQTDWTDKTEIYAQPRFWPALSLAAMLAFGALHYWRQPRRKLRKADWAEARAWLRPAEFALWFMAYVWAAPVIGFLFASLVFAPALAWRMGYRRRATLWIAAGFGAAVVVVFKGLLSVKIPGALVYEYLPDGLRSFFILYL